MRGFAPKPHGLPSEATRSYAPWGKRSLPSLPKGLRPGQLRWLLVEWASPCPARYARYGRAKPVALRAMRRGYAPSNYPRQSYALHEGLRPLRQSKALSRALVGSLRSLDGPSACGLSPEPGYARLLRSPRSSLGLRPELLLPRFAR